MANSIRLGLSFAVVAMICTGVSGGRRIAAHGAAPSAAESQAWLDVLGGSVFLDGRAVRRYVAVRVADGAYGC